MKGTEMFYLTIFQLLSFDDEYKVRKEQRWDLLTGGKQQY